ncbi:hypothetical protein A2425_03990 [candidate division WWE3 bacterium RIFOXYC1_FULL_42_17]|nr:MAG: hypothetical protein A2425_03990 [candidate division WWE3 bacterium RIFOXYC1_FULL_42_17]
MTNKTKTTLNMSLIPLVVIVVLMIGAGYFLLQGEIKLPGFNKGTQIRRLDGFPTVITTEMPLEKQRKVIKSPEELAEFLNYIDPTGLTEVRDSVNFDREYLLAVSSDLQDETGHKMRIKKVYEDKNTKHLLVLIEETDKGDNCEVEVEGNITSDVVAISKTDYEISFDRVKKVENCEKEETTEETPTEGQSSPQQ